MYSRALPVPDDFILYNFVILLLGGWGISLSLHSRRYDMDRIEAQSRAIAEVPHSVVGGTQGESRDPEIAKTTNIICITDPINPRISSNCPAELEQCRGTVGH